MDRMAAQLWFFIISMFVSDDLSVAAKKEMVQNTSVLLDELLQGYDKRLRPDFGASPTLVDVNLNIRSMGPISDRDMAYQMDCYFRQSWVDKRLEFTGMPMKTLPVGVNVLDRIWKPDTHFFNGRKSYLHTVTTPNKLLRINRDGRLLYSMRLTIKASCPMHLEKFPMDTQTCPLQLGSHGYDVNEIQYVWTNGANKSIKMASDMTLSQFDLIGFPQGHSNTSKPGAHQPFSMLSASFVLRRHMGYFLINVYVPCSLMVVISWVSFWINREATADRIALGITTVLTMAFLGIDNRRDLPIVSYSTALDYFVGICFAFVLATIIQFAGVHFFTKHGSGEVFVVPESSSDEEDINDEEDDRQRERYLRCRMNERRMSIRTMSIGFREHRAKMNGATRRPQLNSLSEEAEPGSSYRKHSMDDAVHTKEKPEGFWSKFWNCLKGSADYRNMKQKLTPVGINSVSKIDKISRIMFPVTFVSFHTVYWLLYLDGSDNSGMLDL